MKSAPVFSFLCRDSPLSCGSAKLREMFGQPNFAHRVARQHQQSWVTEMHGGNLFHSE